MFDIARFQIIGRVGAIKKFDGATKVRIATNAAYKEDGEWKDRTYWNEVVVFNRTTRGWIEKRLEVGDVVRVEGILRDSNYNRDGETVYTTELVVEDFNRQPKKGTAEGTEATGK